MLKTQTVEDRSDALLFTIREAALMLGISQREVYRAISSGKLLSVSIGRLRRISRGALERYVADLEAESADKRSA